VTPGEDTRAAPHSQPRLLAAHPVTNLSCYLRADARVQAVHASLASRAGRTCTFCALLAARAFAQHAAAVPPAEVARDGAPPRPRAVRARAPAWRRGRRQDVACAAASRGRSGAGRAAADSGLRGVRAAAAAARRGGRCVFGLRLGVRACGAQARPARAGGERPHFVELWDVGADAAHAALRPLFYSQACAGRSLLAALRAPPLHAPRPHAAARRRWRASSWCMT